MNLTETGWEVVHWIYIVQDVVMRWNLVNIGMIRKCWNFLI
jgi:hypothetical protein